jgi:hypothetical protein
MNSFAIKGGLSERPIPYILLKKIYLSFSSCETPSTTLFSMFCLRNITKQCPSSKVDLVEEKKSKGK